jgi:hypothetical protein
MSNGPNPPQGGQPPEAASQPAQRRGAPPAKFTVEFGDSFLRNHTINTPPMQTVVRGAFSLPQLARRERDGKKYTMPDIGSKALRIPEFPGAQMSIDCRTRKVRLFDPLDSPDGKELLEQYNNLAKSEQGQGLPRNLGPFKAMEHTLDKDQLKTLVIELARKIESKCCRVVDGDFPDPAQIDAMDGDELYDPQNTSSDKPRYKKDYQRYRDKLAAAGI